MKRGFTLIELLIVVAIIAILAAIAVPNFLEAQMRAKISRAKSDMRTITTGLESYAVDNNKYPILNGYIPYGLDYARGGIHMCLLLTTPISYLDTVFYPDPFSNSPKEERLAYEDDERRPYSYCFVHVPLTREDYLNVLPVNMDPKWGIFSLGPDYVKGPDPTGAMHTPWHIAHYADDVPNTAPTFGDRFFGLWEYDPTNGSKSAGDILRFQR
ncbi:prepilin-type N-terminal cleavage/methylation domain-containing protein [bacterium]|nr:prepilin-type N-terminal cleavage/methylation domain-containing protein [bacterium]